MHYQIHGIAPSRRRKNGVSLTRQGPGAHDGVNNVYGYNYYSAFMSITKDDRQYLRQVTHPFSQDEQD